jgi:ABC-type branched-subunit amino acid transport system ATPase component
VGEARRPPQHLVVRNLSAGYAGNLVVRDINVSVGAGEVAVVLGPNGSGKSTVMKAVTGQIEAVRGSVHVGGLDVTNKPSEQLAQLGMGYIPQDNDVFSPLTVHENLLMGGALLSKREAAVRIDEIYSRFPVLARLRSSRGGRLSGGERKLLAMGRVLMLRPSLVVLDEPTANLSPGATRDVLADHVKGLAEAGTAVLLVEQKALQALEIADWAYILVAGAVELEAPASELASRGDIGELFLGKVPVSSPRVQQGEL